MICGYRIFVSYHTLTLPMSVSVKSEAKTDSDEKCECVQNVEIGIKSEKGPDLPTKSSMEILSELFSTFHAEPPLIIKKEDTEEVTKPKHKKKKKHKHKEKKHKKKSKKKHRSSNSSSDDDSKVDLAELLIKQEKDASTKRLKIAGTGLSLSLDQHDIQKQDLNESDCNTPEGSPQHKYNKSNKITIQDLKKSSVYETILKGSTTDCHESDGNIRGKHKKKHKHKSKKRSRSNSRDKHKKIKVDDLRDILNEKESKSMKHGHKKDLLDEYDLKDSYRNRERSRERKYGRSFCDKYKDDYDRDSKKSRRDNPFYKSYKDEVTYRTHERDRSSRDRYRDYTDKSRYRSRSTSRERDSSSKFDKKKLLEIARKNAIAMMKSGSLPAALTLGPQAQEKVIAAIRSGGKTIEELTDFCKTLSRKEELGELSSLSEKDDSDSDTDKPFHHPFQIKERPTTITLNIKNSVPLPVKSSLERTTELRMQFPVSSGQQHRKDEDWRPVSPPASASRNEKKVIPVMAQPIIPTSSIPLPPEPTPKHNFTSTETAIQMQSKQLSIGSSTNVVSTQTFNSPANGNVDLGTIVSQRLAAIRKLQENPDDVSALNQVYKSDKEMQTWASSKQAPFGQFRGSTGAQIMSQSELSSGYQAWAKKDQLQTAAPVSGGMGMHLLQKMGWKPGEGLGKEKTGSLEPLLLEVKLDKRGLVANEEQQKGKMRKMKTVASVKNLQGKHPVSLLGEYASKKKIGAPQYILEFECGPDHKKNFLFKVVLNGVEYKPNIASNNKKEAKAAAAALCLQKIGLLPNTTALSVPQI